SLSKQFIPWESARKNVALLSNRHAQLPNLQIAIRMNFHLPTPHSLLPTPYSLLPTPFCPSRIHCQVSTVHRNQGPSNPGGRIGCQEHGEALDIVRLAEAAGGDAAEELGAEIWVGGHTGLEAGIEDLGGEDGVDADAAAAPFGAELSGHL